MQKKVKIKGKRRQKVTKLAHFAAAAAVDKCRRDL